MSRLEEIENFYFGVPNKPPTENSPEWFKELYYLFKHVRRLKEAIEEHERYTSQFGEERTASDEVLYQSLEDL